MENYNEQGLRIGVTLTAAVTPGTFMLIGGSLPAASIIGGAIGDTIEFMTRGVFSLSKDTNAISQGTPVYWDATNSVATATSTKNTLIGYAFKDAAAGDTTVMVYIK